MKDVRLSDFHFELPEQNIPAYPLEKRDESRLLVYRRGKIGHHRFYDLPSLLPENAFLVFNNTKVIPARLICRRETGARIEILLLEPANGEDIQLAMQVKNHSLWNCMIGNLKKWKDSEVLRMPLEGTTLQIQLADRENPRVRLQWEGDLTLSDILEMAGKLPLPPYIHRNTEDSDKEQYQTVFAEEQGAVAAPTAGLHFTNEILDTLKEKGISTGFVTLHVGAGTFQPVKVENPASHPMHNEKMVLEKSFIENLMDNNGFIIPVGTTSMRTLESLYWFGCKLREKGNTGFYIEKLEAYSLKPLSTEESLKEVLSYMAAEKLDVLHGQTEILIMPGYVFRICRGLITNFHLPETTLILLVAAFIGESWKKVYNSALENGYRFLSFGDSSLLIP